MSNEDDVSLLLTGAMREDLRLNQSFKATLVQLEKAIAEIATTYEATEFRTLSAVTYVDLKQVVLRVKDGIKLGQRPEFSSIEQSAIMSNFVQLDLRSLEAMLEWFPGCIRKLQKAVLSRWSPSGVSSLTTVLELLARRQGRDRNSSLFQGGLLLDPDLPKKLIFDLKKEATILEAALHLRRLRPLRHYYQLGQISLAEHLLRLARVSPTDFLRELRLLKQDVSFQHLTPQAGLETKVVGSPVARCIVIAAMIQTAIQSKDEVRNGLFQDLAQLRLTEFGDPRVQGRSALWEDVRVRIPEELRAYISLLNEENIEFFFNRKEIGVDFARKRFWLQYKGSFERTVVVLSPEKFRDLLATCVDTNESINRILSQARAFKHMSSHHALIMVFRNVACIEFHETGAACLVLPRDLFDLKVAPLLLDQIQSADGMPNLGRQTVSIQDNSRFRWLWKKVLEESGKGVEGFNWKHQGQWPRVFTEKLRDWFGVIKG